MPPDEEEAELTLHNVKASVSGLLNEMAGKIEEQKKRIDEHETLLLGEKGVEGKRGVVNYVRTHSFYFKIIMYVLGVFGAGFAIFVGVLSS